jgi:hypothetical protein
MDAWGCASVVEYQGEGGAGPGRSVSQALEESIASE